jgi:hypothetical protein
VRAFEKIRYDRVHRAQAMGPAMRERWHRAIWDKVWKRPELIHLTREPWLLHFDAESDAYENYSAVVASIGQAKAHL